MSAEHKRPLYAFVLVAMLCAFLMLGSVVRAHSPDGLFKAAVPIAGPAAAQQLAAEPPALPVLSDAGVSGAPAVTTLLTPLASTTVTSSLPRTFDHATSSSAEVPGTAPGTPAEPGTPEGTEPDEPGHPDKAAEKAERKAEKAAEKAERKAEKAKRKAEKAAEKAKRKAEKAAEKAERKAEKAAEKAKRKGGKPAKKDRGQGNGRR